MPWMREDLGEETDHSMKEISEEEALFLSKLQMIGISFELSLAILSEMRRTGGDIPKEKYESWGFADAFSMGYVELQYQLTQEGMTVEQVDYLESDARFSLALQVTAINLAIAGIKVIGQITSPEQSEPELESQTTAKTGNKISDPTAEQKTQFAKEKFNLTKEDIKNSTNKNRLPKFPKDPTIPPTSDYEWRGPADKGSWYNPKTGESMRPDLNHPAPIKPHYDYRAPDGTWYRIFEDGTYELKE